MDSLSHLIFVTALAEKFEPEKQSRKGRKILKGILR